MKHALALFFGLALACASHSQDPVQPPTVSLITCGSGDDLYSVFGHSAIHIYHPLLGIDKVYNYGTFDFDTPNFYVKFARGQLEYALAVGSFERFVFNYQYEGRWVKRQVLDLTAAETEALYSFLENNALPENRNYKYDFFYDNCSSRIRDVFESVLGPSMTYPAAARDSFATFRQMIDLYLTNHPWSDLGIDLALGIPCDRQADYRNKMFLPDYLMAAFEDAEVLRPDGSRPLVISTQTVLQENPVLRAPPTGGITWGFWVFFGVCLLASIFINPARMKWFDIMLFGAVGILGIVIVLLWVATDHSATKWNMNLLWALPSWLFGAYLVAKDRTEGKFFKYHSAFLFFVVIAWMWIPQTLHTAVIPLVLALITRSWSWQKRIFALNKSTDGNQTTSTL